MSSENWSKFRAVLVLSGPHEEAEEGTPAAHEGYSIRVELTLKAPNYKAAYKEAENICARMPHDYFDIDSLDQLAS